MLRRGWALMLTLAALGLPSLVPWGSAGSDVLAAEQAEHMMRTYVVGSGGAPTSSDHFRANGTVGQPTPIGIGTSSTRVVYAGFWGRRWALMGVEPPATYRNEFLQNYPNPFNPVTTIKYSIGSAGLVEIAIFDVEGRRIRTLVSEVEAPGAYTAVWDGRNDGGAPVAPGIHFCRMRAGSFGSVKKILLVR
jgi:hypothetical protein